MTMALSPEDKLIKARINLLRDNPFFGRLAMRLQLCESNQIDTTATDGDNLYWSRAFIADICNDKDVEFAVEHEVMHVVQDAFGRMPIAANPVLWNLACDFVINTLILDSGFTDSPILTDLCTTQVQTLARGKTSEQVYREIMKDAPKCKACDMGLPLPSPSEDNGSQPGSSGENKCKDHGHKHEDKGDSSESKENKDKGKDGGGKSKPKHTCNPKGCCSATLGKKMTERQKAQWKQAIIAAAEIAKGQGKLPGHLQDMLGKLLEPVVSWRDIVRCSAAKAFRGRWTWNRKSRRQGSFSLRRIARDPNPKGAVIMLDTSGSISDGELKQFVSESVEIMRVCKAPWIDVLLHDTDCYKVWRIGKSIEDNWGVRRGGTSHIDVFKTCMDREEKPGLIIAFTDLETSFPAEQPPCEVIWAHPKGYGEIANIPWGRKVLVDFSEE